MQRELGAELMLRKGGIDADGRSTEGARHQKPSEPQVITAGEGETGTVIALENPCTGLANAQPGSQVYRVLVEVVEAMREGKVIPLVPRTQRLTSQEAADFLGVSRPTMVKLLEDGRIPFDQPGRHRRILFTDLLAYTERQHAGRRAALDRMTEDASESGIYGGTPEDYAAALRKARRRAARQEGSCIIPKSLFEALDTTIPFRAQCAAVIISRKLFSGQHDEPAGAIPL